MLNFAETWVSMRLCSRVELSLHKIYWSGKCLEFSCNETSNTSFFLSNPLFPSLLRLKDGPGQRSIKATGYGLGGPRIESRWGRKFPHSFRPAFGSTPAPVSGVLDFLPGVKRPQRGVHHPPSSRAEVKDIVELYVYSIWAFVVCYRVNFNTAFYYS